MTRIRELGNKRNSTSDTPTNYRQALTEQVARDTWTLDHDPTPAPSYDFYVQRIIAYTEEVVKLG